MRSRSFIPCMKIFLAIRYLEAKIWVSETYDLQPIDQKSSTRHWQKSAITLLPQNKKPAETISRVLCK